MGNIMRVLLADDDASQRFMLGDMLEEWGYEVRAVEDGAAAWEAIQEETTLDLLMLDWEMPHMNGVEVCRLAKGLRTTKYLYVLIVTARTAKGDIVQGLEAGADDFLSKPVDPDELRCRLAVGARIIKYEQEVREKNRALLLFSQAFEHSVQEMCITNVKGAAVHINPAFLKRYGYNAQELLGQSMQTLTPDAATLEDLGFAPEEQERRRVEIRQRLSDPALGHWVGTLPHRTKSGSTVWTHLHVSGIRDEKDGFIGYLYTPDDITERVEQERRIQLECYRAITELAEARDNETGAHLKRLSEYAGLLARTMGLPRKYAGDMAVFAPLHDIGKVAIPDAILLAERSLTKEEFETMKTHSTVGYEILKDKATLEMAAEIAYTHHEKFNGNGYPRGLAGESIPLSGRIVALCDVYDALRSARPYKAPWPHEKTATLLYSEAGAHFDPNVVEAFRQVEEQMRAIFDQNAGADAPAPLPQPA